MSPDMPDHRARALVAALLAVLAAAPPTTARASLVSPDPAPGGGLVVAGIAGALGLRRGRAA